MFEPNLGLMIVADGMGGHNSGEVASRLATTICMEQFKKSIRTGHVPVFFHVPKNPDLDPRSLILGDCVKFANSAVYEASQGNEEHKNMGTTFVAALWLDNKIAVAHVGDSRLYRFRSGDLVQCTIDHSFIQEQLNKGLITPEDAEKSDMQNLLTRSIGIEEDVKVDITEVDIIPGDFILLCSDGLTKMLSHEEITDFFKSEPDPDKVVEKLVEQANAKGGRDNVTVLVAKMEGSPIGWRSFKNRVKSMFKKKAETN